MAKKVTSPTITGAVALKLRNKLGIPQHEFWSRLGCTQSGGSRYESGRNMPRPVKKLFFLTYIATPWVLSGKDGAALEAI